jgi:NTP pyrophosphatase (non-canonical NTP hydrolase)
MKFSEYQTYAARTALYPGRGSNGYYPAMGLAGEVGEVLNKMKKVMRDDGGVVTDARKEDLKSELGDVLWYMSALADELKITLEDVALSNIQKLKGRQERGTLTGSGDAR